MTTSGKIQALTLSLDAQPEEYYGPYSYDATGFKILVHDQNESYPNIEDFGVDLPPGFTTTIRVRRTKVSLKRLWSALFETSVSSHLAPVVQTLGRAIHRINHYPADKCKGNQLRYPLDRFLSGG